MEAPAAAGEGLEGLTAGWLRAGRSLPARGVPPTSYLATVLPLRLALPQALADGLPRLEVSDLPAPPPDLPIDLRSMVRPAACARLRCCPASCSAARLFRGGRRSRVAGPHCAPRTPVPPACPRPQPLAKLLKEHLQAEVWRLEEYVYEIPGMVTAELRPYAVPPGQPGAPRFPPRCRAFNGQRHSCAAGRWCECSHAWQRAWQ